MNFFKKISPKVVAFLIIVYLSFILTGCPSNQALTEFQDTYNITFRELVEKQDALSQEYNEYVQELKAIEDDFKDLDPKMELSLFKRKIFKLSQRALLVIKKLQEMLEKQMDIIIDQSQTISRLHGNVIKIKDPSKKLLAQKIADKLRKLNNLMDELTELREKETKYFYSYWEDVKAVSLDKMTLERAVKDKEERGEKIEENQEEMEELWKAIRSLITEIADLKAKLDSLGP